MYRCLTIPVVLFVAAGPLAAGASAAETEGAEHDFYVDAEKSYSDYIQFPDGRAQGVCVFYFRGATSNDEFNRLVVFCHGNGRKGHAYEDPKNKRVVLSRPLSEYSAFARFQRELGTSNVYGRWVTDADGDVTRVALQTYRQGNVVYSHENPPPNVEEPPYEGE